MYCAIHMNCMTVEGSSKTGTGWSLLISTLDNNLLPIDATLPPIGRSIMCISYWLIFVCAIYIRSSSARW